MINAFFMLFQPSILLEEGKKEAYGKVCTGAMSNKQQTVQTTIEVVFALNLVLFT